MNRNTKNGIRLNRIRIAMCLLGIAFSAPISAQYNYPGGLVDLQISKENSELPDVKFGLQDVVVIDQKLSWRILVGISLDTVPGEYLIYIKRQSENSPAFSQKFEIVQKYSSAFNDTPTDNQLAVLEHDSLSEISFTNSVQPELPLAYPAEGKWADYFGLIAVGPSNDSVTSRNYISLTTTEVTPVLAPQNAIISRVVEHRNDVAPSSKSRYTLYLDHGRGLFSIISGMTDITVESGNGITAGAVLGKIYASSNAEPGTLLWQTILNGAYVNPTILTKLP